MSRELGAVLFAAVILLLVAWAAVSGGGLKLAAAQQRSCPPRTALALDGFCTHVYSPTSRP